MAQRLLVTVPMLLSLALLSSCSETTEQKYIKLQQQIQKDNAKLIDLVKVRLKDPESAQFKNLTASSGDNGKSLCGLVNSKNSLGGYVGYSEFVATENPMQDSASNVVFIEPGLAKYKTFLDVKRAGCEVWWHSGHQYTECKKQRPTQSDESSRMCETGHTAFKRE